MAKILIVDDAAFMRMVLKDILVKGGHEVVAEAANGREAITAIKANEPDLVTLDITMPEVDGLQTLTKMKEAGLTCPVVMCSAMGQQSFVEQAILSGAKDFIVKPFQPDRVLAAIERVLSKVKN